MYLFWETVNVPRNYDCITKKTQKTLNLSQLALQRWESQETKAHHFGYPQASYSFFSPTPYLPFYMIPQKGKKKNCDKTLVTLDLNWTDSAVSYSSVTHHFRKKQTFLGFISFSIFVVKAASHLEQPGIQAPIYEDNTKANTSIIMYIYHIFHLYLE